MAPPKPVASIDLHGYRKEEAIARVTQFLESTLRSFRGSTITGGPALWVCIITGSGHHSHAGPVLREAVRSLLDRREMEYALQYGKGSFLVNACSGYELAKVPRTATDTKLIIKPSSSGDQCYSKVRRLVHRPTTVTRPTPAAAAAAPKKNVGNSQRVTSLLAPLPSEVAADDKLLDRIKFESENDYRKTKQRDEQLLRLAITASKRELERQENEEEERLAAILRQSEHDEELLQEQEEERLEHILRYSREEEERIKILGEDKQLADALLESQQEEPRQEQEQEEFLRRARSQSQVHVSEHDQALKQALDQSVRELNAVDSDLNRALSMSIHEQTAVPNEQEQEELLRRALSLSQVNVSEHDQALTQALEQSVRDLNAVDSELNRALSMSLHEETAVPNEEKLMERVLQLSIAESATKQEHFVEHVDYIIEEVD